MVSDDPEKNGWGNSAWVSLLVVAMICLTGCGLWNGGPDEPFLVDRVTMPRRLNVRSPWYPLQGEQLELYTNYCGWDVRGQERLTHLEIGEKVKSMVAEADELILGT